MDPSII